MEKLVNLKALEELEKATMVATEKEKAAKAAEEIKLAQEWAKASIEAIASVDKMVNRKKLERKLNSLNRKFGELFSPLFKINKEFIEIRSKVSTLSTELNEAIDASKTLKAAIERAAAVGIKSSKVLENFKAVEAAKKEIREKISSHTKSMDQLVKKAAKSLYWLINNKGVEPIGLDPKFIKMVHSTINSIEKWKKIAAKKAAKKAAEKAAKSSLEKSDGVYTPFKDLLLK